MQVKIANPRAGGSARLPLSAKLAAYFLLASYTSVTILLILLTSFTVLMRYAYA